MKIEENTFTYLARQNQYGNKHISASHFKQRRMKAESHFVSLTGSCLEICKIIQCPNEHSCRQMSFDYVLVGSFLPIICSVMLLMERPAENTWHIRGILQCATACMVMHLQHLYQYFLSFNFFLLL